jgi:hypothetical protein
MRRPILLASPPALAVQAAMVGLVFSALAVQPPSARAEGDEHALVQAMVDQTAKADGQGGHGPVATELLDHARKELDRATRLRATFDEKRARAADGAAREWAETARDLLRAVEAEGHAGDVRGKALDKQAQVERTRALVDEDIARIGRLKAELEAADKSARKDENPDRHAVEMHEGDPPPKKKTASKKGVAPDKSPPKTTSTGPGAPP